MAETYLSPEQSAEKRSQRTDVAARQFKEAAALAARHRLRLRKCDDIQYQLIPLDAEWLLNIYPSNRRLYHDPNRRGPFLRVREDWTLLDVVKAAVAEVD